MGRPTIYTEEIADSICEKLAEGQSLNAICKPDEMPHESTVRAWALNDTNGFSTKYTRARELQALVLADELIEIADTGNGEDVNRARLRVDTRKWYLSKVIPKVYGDKLAVEHDLTKLSDAELIERAKGVLGGAVQARPEPQ